MHARTQTFSVLELPLTYGKHLCLTLFVWVEERSMFGNNLVQEPHVTKSVRFVLYGYKSVNGLEASLKIHFLWQGDNLGALLYHGNSFTLLNSSMS